MTIDPVTAAAATAAITKTTSWLWDKYGKELLSRLGQEGKKEWDQQKWKKSAQKYLDNLYEDVSTLRVLGKSENQPIERMYTDVNVLGELSAERRVKLAQLPDEYEERVGLRWQQKVRQDGLNLARETKRLFILGKPGAGKTTFLKHVALQTIKGEMGEKIPIFISLWRLANSGQALMPYIVEQFRICGFPEAEPFVRDVLKDGRALVLFDGLDEVRVENEQRDQLITAVEDFGREFRDSQVFITCRLAVTDYHFDGFRYVEMADFDKKQMQTFVFRWFQHDMAQRDACWEALQADHNKTLRELAQVPLLLSLLCLTYEKRNEFPQERDEIYKEATDALLNDWDASRRIKRGREFVRENAVYENLTLKHKQKLLAHVAAQTFDDGQYFIEEEKLASIIETFLPGVPGLKDKAVDGVEVLRVMEAQHGIFVERAHKIHSFSHLTLQEYYAARYIVENEAGGTLPRLMSHVGDIRWREVFLLTARMLSDATSFGNFYLQALREMVANEKKLVALLQTCAIKSMRGEKSPAGRRAFYLYLALALIPEPYDDIIFGDPPNLTLALASSRDFAQICDLNILSGRDPLLDLALLTRDIKNASEISREISAILTPILAPDMALYYLLGVSLQVAIHLQDLISHPVELNKVLVELRGALSSIDQFCGELNLPDLQNSLILLSLRTLRIGTEPNRALTYKELVALASNLRDIVYTYCDLELKWKLYDGEAKLLEMYLQANLLFVECLHLAYVPDRAAIENQILLPPTMS